ncbi:MAG TPA: TIGR03013 family XrtA/PEP-CTERM system glycosyltransferase [Vicinamibacterales bacterium]|nr:TIGR03013 family XrtA/PEP-CTERM system glycosyltransferase [Vicinamibacterales bacterium]
MNISRRAALLVIAESCLIMAAVWLAAYIRLSSWMWEVMIDQNGMWKAALIAAVCQLCLYYSDLYDFRRVADRKELLVRIIQALGGASFVLAAVYYWFPATMIGRGVFFLAAGLISLFITAWRVAFEWLSNRVEPTHRVLLVGIGSAAIKLERELMERRQALGVEIVGFIDADPTGAERPADGVKVIGRIEDIPSIVKSRAVDRVVVSLADARGKLPMDKLLDMKLQGVTFDHIASVYEEFTGKIAVENLRPSWLIFSEGFRDTAARRAVKRAMDITAATIGLILAAPIMLLVGILVRVTSPGPVLFRQTRVGQSSRPFLLFKFRSMRADAEAATGPVWAQPGDSRVTPVGQFLRMSRLDELPQLWNVLIGEMSLVGPRPERPEFVEQLTSEIPFYGQRHVVRPGLTGWAQVRYKYGATKADALEKLQYELYYIKNMSIALDLVIMLQTIKTMISGAEHGTPGTLATPVPALTRAARDKA